MCDDCSFMKCPHPHTGDIYYYNLSPSSRDPPAAPNTRRRITGHRHNGDYLGSRYTGTGGLTNLLRSCQYFALFNKRYFPLWLNLCPFSCPNVCLHFQMSPQSSQVQVPGCGGGVYYWRVSRVNTRPARARPKQGQLPQIEIYVSAYLPSPQPPPRGDTRRIKQLDLRLHRT